MSFFARFFKACWTMVVPLVLTLIASTVLFFTGHESAATTAYTAGVGLTFFGNVIYLFVLTRKRR